MKSFGPIYVGRLRYYHNNLLPIVEIGHTQETEDNYRKGKCFVFRVPKGEWGHYLGVFYKSYKNPTDEDAIKLISSALRRRDMGLTAENIEEWDVKSQA